MTDLPPPPRVDVVVVSWHHDRWLGRCLSSLVPAATETFRLGSVVVVDNAGTVESLPALLGDAPVTLIRNGENDGFARGCNQGAAPGSGDWILFLNPDAALRPSALTRALAALAAPLAATVGIAGLRLVDEHGLTQRTCGRFPSLTALICQAMGLSRLLPAPWSTIRMVDWAHDDSRRVDFACGAALLVRRTLFEALGGFDERLFLYLEDADLARRASAAGWRAWFVHDAVVEHACGWTGRTDRAWRLAQSWRSMVVYARLHLGPLPAVVLTLALGLLAPVARVVEALCEGRLSGAIDAGRAWVVWARLVWTEFGPARPQNGVAIRPEGEQPHEA